MIAVREEELEELSLSVLWEMGDIASWYLREDQLPIYELLRSSKAPFIECARRYGKTTSILCYVLEELIRNPGYICRWCEPDKNQAREIVVDELEKVQAHAPKHLRFKYSVVDSVFKHPNGSKLYLRGVNHDRGDSARGPTANIIVADEFGTWKDPDYIVTSALRPQLQTTNGPFIFASTPPEDLGHAYYEHKAWAIEDGRFIQRIIHDNKSLSPERIQELIKECRGEDTPAWRREYLCEPVSDPERLVIPEFKEGVHVRDEYPRPEYFDAYVGADLGFNDATAFLFAFYDFKENTLVIEDELFVHGKNSREIVEMALGKERSLWGDKPPYRRIADNDLQQLYDMRSMLGYAVSPTRKDDLLAAVNSLRLRFQTAKIVVLSRCKSLIFQLKVGLWNERRTDFVRSDKTKHLDSISALIYLNRNIDLSRNPFPLLAPGVSPYTHYIPPQNPMNLVPAEALEISALLRGSGRNGTR